MGYTTQRIEGILATLLLSYASHEFRWYDLRIDFRDLNNISSLNSMNEKDRSVIWVPKLGFVNALGPFQTVVDDLVTGLLVREDEAPLSEDISLPIEGGYNKDSYRK